MMRWLQRLMFVLRPTITVAEEGDVIFVNGRVYAVRHGCVQALPVYKIGQKPYGRY